MTTKTANKPVTLDQNSDSYRILGYLKEVIHARGMRYRELAALIGVSEKSIKRYLGGRGLNLSLLERLCAAVGISLCELANLASSDDDGEPVWTTKSQEDALAADLRLSIVNSLLTMGWSAARIVRDGLASESQLTAILVRLDRLGIITLYPGNRTRVRARLRPFDACSAAFRQVISDAGARVIKSFDPAGANARWRMNFARLGPASAARARSRLHAFVDEISALSRQDMDLSGDQVKWYAVCALTIEHDILGLRLLRNSDDTPQEKALPSNTN